MNADRSGLFRRSPPAATPPAAGTAPPARGGWSLQSRLRRRLVSALAALWLLAALASWATQQVEFNEVLDEALEDSARRLLLMRPAAPTAGGAPAPAPEHEQDIELQLFDAEGRLLWRSHEAPLHPLAPLGRAGLRNEGRWRVAVARDRHDGRVAVAAEQLADRAETLAAALPGLLLPLLALLPAAALIVHLLLRQGFRSLEPARAALARRDGGDLSTLPADGLPRELLPLVEALNALLGRVAALVAAERQFAAAGAHELRTPLAAALAQLQRLLEELPAEGAAHARALALERQLRRLSDLGSKLLQLARVDAGVGLAREPVELKALVRLVLDEFRRAGDGDAPRWRLDGPAEQVWVAGDLDALGIALRNLVENAQRHAGRAARLSIAVGRDGTVAVEDDGPGVAPEQLAALVQPFRREHREAEGSGLGLAIADAVARQSGGTLRLASPVANGRGFRATLALPVVVPPAAAPAAPISRPPA